MSTTFCWSRYVIFVAAVKIATLNPKSIPTFSALKKLSYNKVSIVGMYLSQEPLQVFIFANADLCLPLDERNYKWQMMSSACWRDYYGKYYYSLNK